MAFVKLSVFLISLITVLHSTLAAASSVQSFFPLNNGDSKSYLFDANGSVNQVLQLSYITDASRSAVFVEVDSADGSKVLYDNRGGELTMPGIILADGSYIWFTQPLVIFTDQVVQNGGKYNSSVNTFYDGIPIYITVETSIDLAGRVNVPSGGYSDCRHVSFDMEVFVNGGSQPLVMNNVWTLAPGVGKIQIEVADENNNFIDTAELTAGAVAGVAVSEYAGRTNNLAAIYSFLLAN